LTAFGVSITDGEGGAGAAVAEYRAYTVGSDGHFVGSQALICSDDAEAIEKANRLVDGHDIELWRGDRFIIRLVPKPK
jgi:hypothetical protein